MAEESFSFGSLLRRQRLAARLTQEELAARCGLGARTIQNLERGANLPRPETLGRLASSLGLAGEARARFEAAAGPLPPGPRDPAIRPDRSERTDVADIVHLANRRRSDVSPKQTPINKHDENPPNLHQLHVSNNLPVQRTSFIGREASLAAVLGLLESNRLLTLTGTGGCGKTRLALEAARRLADRFSDGAWLVELAPLADTALVGQAIAAILGLRETAGKPITRTLIEHLQTKRSLLVVDNCEHVIEGAAQIVDAMLSECPGLVILATSREALRIPGEVDWRVPSLAVPSTNPTEVGDLLGVESVRLLVERGRAVRTDFGVTSQNAQAVARICRQLDGIPLAIELAATRVKALSLEDIAGRLDQRFRFLTAGSRAALPRQQTLAATVRWSYDLFAGSERALFNRLSVFAGGFTLEAAALVCEATADVAGPLSELVSKSMVDVDDSTGDVERYHLLETLRQYGRERLAEAGEEEKIRGRHAAYYLQFAEDTRPHLFGPDQLVYLARLDREWDNLRAALRWYIDRAEAEPGLRIMAALEFFLWYRGLDETEGHAWRTQLLQLPATDPPSLARANALLWSGTALNQIGDFEGGHRAFADALAIARHTGDGQALAWIMHRVGRYGGPDYEEWYGVSERGLTEGALALFRAGGNRWGVAVSLSWLGHLAYHDRDPENAFQLLEESLSLARAVGERHCVAFALRHLGEATITESDHAAGAYLRESLRLYRELTDVQGVACVENFLGRLDCRYGRFASAREHYRAGLRWFMNGTWLQMMAQSMEGLAMVAVGQGQLVRALRLAAASALQREVSAQPAFAVEQAELERVLASVRPTIGESARATALADGRSMTLKQAIAYALADDE